MAYRPSYPDLKNKWTHTIDCLKRKLEEQRAQIEYLKAETEKRTWIHETAITDVHSKDQIIARYRSKAKRCSHALEVMLKQGLQKDMMADVIQNLIAEIID